METAILVSVFWLGCMYVSYLIGKGYGYMQGYIDGVNEKKGANQ